MHNMVITIDGPAGAGKTTVSRGLADRLGYRYIDTGALYRGVALAARQAGVAPDDDEGLAALCQGLRLVFVRDASGCRLYNGEEDIEAKIRTPEISMLASAVSARPVVRRFLLEVQRQFAREKGAVFEGRDMGTVVFPDAEVKFFLDAPLAIRARRRHAELVGRSDQTLEDVLKDMIRGPSSAGRGCDCHRFRQPVPAEGHRPYARSHWSVPSRLKGLQAYRIARILLL